METAIASVSKHAKPPPKARDTLSFVDVRFIAYNKDPDNEQFLL